MPLLPLPIQDNDPSTPSFAHFSTSDSASSTAFFDQFSTIIRLEARLYGDNSEDTAGPSYNHWVLRHLSEVALAQAFPPSPPPAPLQATTLNVHAQEFTTPPRATAKVSSRPSVHGSSTPWYENFNLADQGVYDPSDPYQPESQHLSRSRTPYTAFDPVELAQYRAVIREQLVHSSNQSGGKQSREVAAKDGEGKEVEKKEGEGQ